MTIRAALGFFALALGSLFLESADLARAVDATLDQVGGVCIPDGATIRAGLYETRGFGIGFRGSNTGTIRLLCPFTVTGNMIGLKIGITMLSFIDGDGIAEGARSPGDFSSCRTRKQRSDHEWRLRFEHINSYGTDQHRLLFPRGHD